jgi:(S)-ureidoglycine aminohydrolase
MDIFGQTRSKVVSDYALITPDTHVPSPLVGWQNASAVIHIAPHLGARFLQYTATLESGATSATPGPGIQRFFYVQHGQCDLKLDDDHSLTEGCFAFIPADTDHAITCQQSATLVVFEKRYQPHPDHGSPKPIVGDAANIDGEPFMGDPDARLQTLLPIAAEFDMAVNIFTYQSGATLPQIEIHTMEHGLVMLSGQGVYRLSQDYHPVAAGDVIWMKSFCPQWFVAMGKTPASYLYYKDIHRDRISETSVLQ